MAAAKGHRKWGGRAKGTPNKSTDQLFDICKKHKCDPFEGMVIIAMETHDPGKRFDRFSKIAEYLYPKRKAIEHSGEIGQPEPAIREESLEDRLHKVKGA